MDQPDPEQALTGQVPVNDKRADMRLKQCPHCGIAHKGECAHERGSE